MKPKTASEMILAKYYVMHDEMSKTHCVFQESGGSDWSGLLVAEYKNKAAAEYICNELNSKSDLEVEE